MFSSFFKQCRTKQYKVFLQLKDNMILEKFLHGLCFKRRLCFFLPFQVTHQLWPVRPIRMWLIAWLSFWPPWCLFHRAAHYHPLHSMPLIITPTPQKLSPSIPCQSWGVTTALTVLSTTLAGKMATRIQKKTNSMTRILRPIRSYIL